MPQEEKKERTYKIYIQATNEFAEVSEEVFKEFYRHCKRERDALRKAGYCLCPRTAVYYCNCDCNHCNYYAYSAGSQYDDEEITHEPVDPLDIEIEMDAHLLKKLIDRLTEIYPDAKTIIKLRYEGYSDSEISRITGIPRRTLDYKLKAALKKLGVSFKDFL